MPPVVSVPGDSAGSTGNSASFTVGKLICIGRNYAAHAAEMQSEVPSEPMIFLKPASAIVANRGSIVIPRSSSDVHHEVELVALIGMGGKDIEESSALAHVAGYAVGLDMTARDIQGAAKKKGHPWSVSKGFDTFAPLGGFVAAETIHDPQQLTISLRVNGDVRQTGNTSDMIFPVARLIAYCSSIMTLEPGDLIYTGTPEGVAAVEPGDRLRAEVPGLPALEVDVVSAGS